MGTPKGNLWTPAKAAKHFGVTPRTVYTWLRAGCLNGRKIGGRWFVTPITCKPIADDAEPVAEKGRRG